MLTSERRRQIAAVVKKESAVTVTSLLEMFDVSVETIRKDLMFLEKNGELVRVHGGAVSKNNVKPFNDFAQRLDEHRAEKRQLSRLAAELVRENDIIGIDAGTTAIEFTEELMARFHSLTIVTYAMDVFERVHAYKDFQVILCGGNYNKKERTFYGVFAKKMLNEIHLQKSFVFPSAISLQKGVYDYQPQILELQQMLIGNSDNVVILADSSKYEKMALYKVWDIHPQHSYVTDDSLPERIKELYLQNEYRIITTEQDLREGFADGL